MSEHGEHCPQMQRPTAHERNYICQQWCVSIRKEIKRNKIGAEIRIATAFAVALVLILLAPGNLLVLVGAISAVIVSVIKALANVVADTKKLTKRADLLTKGAFMVTPVMVEEVVRERNGKYYGRIQESKFRIPFTLMKKITPESGKRFSALLVQPDDEKEMFVIPI